MKDNKLLAEYLGWKPVMVNDKLMYEDMEEHWHSNHFHKDWNQLMMVVEKIERGNWSNNLDLYKNITSAFCLIDGTKIEAVYNACVEYIKQKP